MYSVYHFNLSHTHLALIAHFRYLLAHRHVLEKKKCLVIFYTSVRMLAASHGVSVFLCMRVILCYVRIVPLEVRACGASIQQASKIPYRVSFVPLEL